MQVLYVALGGALGAVLRFSVSMGMVRYMGSGFPWGTLVVNVVGSFVAGFLWSILGSTVGQQRMNALFFIGLLGAFTTFSAYSVESLRLYQDGHAMLAAVNVLANNIGALLAVVGGFMAGSLLTGRPTI